LIEVSRDAGAETGNSIRRIPANVISRHFSTNIITTSLILLIVITSSPRLVRLISSKSGPHAALSRIIDIEDGTPQKMLKIVIDNDD